MMKEVLPGILLHGGEGRCLMRETSQGVPKYERLS